MADPPGAPPSSSTPGAEREATTRPRAAAALSWMGQERREARRLLLSATAAIIGVAFCLAAALSSNSIVTLAFALLGSGSLSLSYAAHPWRFLG